MPKFILGLILLLIACSQNGPQQQSLKPKFLTFGSSVDEMLNALEPLCAKMAVRTITPANRLAKNLKQKIDCQGFRYFDKDRNLELIFQNDQLDLVWILFPEAEKTEFIERFSKAYGEPDLNVEFGLIYLQYNAAIRYQPSEILFASERQVNVILKSLKQPNLVYKRIKRNQSLI